MICGAVTFGIFLGSIINMMHQRNLSQHVYNIKVAQLGDYMNFMKLFMMEDASIETRIFSLNLTDYPEVDYEEAKSTIFWVMRKTEDYQRPFMLDSDDIPNNDVDTIDQYFEFSAVQWDSNWYLPKA